MLGVNLCFRLEKQVYLIQINSHATAGYCQRSAGLLAYIDIHTGFLYLERCRAGSMAPNENQISLVCSTNNALCENKKKEVKISVKRWRCANI